MRRQIGAVFLFLLVQGAVSGYAQEMKIAFVDAQKVLNVSKEGERLKQVLDDFVKTRQSVIDLDEQELKRSQDELEKLRSLLTADAITVKQAEIEKAIDRYREKVSTLQGEVRDKRMGALFEFNQKLEQVVKQISEKEGYGLVLDKNPDRGVVLYGKEAYDITVKVVEQMNALFSKPKAEPKSDPEKK